MDAVRGSNAKRARYQISADGLNVRAYGEEERKATRKVFRETLASSSTAILHRGCIDGSRFSIDGSCFGADRRRSESIEMLKKEHIVGELQASQTEQAAIDLVSQASLSQMLYSLRLKQQQMIADGELEPDGQPRARRTTVSSNQTELQLCRYSSYSPTPAAKQQEEGWCRTPADDRRAAAIRLLNNRSSR